MSATTRAYLAALSALVVTASLSFALAPPVKPGVPNYRITGPHVHENLAIFFLHGVDQIKGKKILTLDEALKARKVVVHETKNVNELSIENVSKEEVFVQAGDIVKGGQQDRTLALDALVPPMSGKIPISSFCVEQGRWAKRGEEDSRAFSRSNNTIVGNRLKLAARGARSQGSVWREVTESQKKLEMVTRATVKDSRSETSLQLTLEHKKVQEAVAAAVKKLEPTLGAGHHDVIGYAVAINGKISSADVYANADLFRRLWPKLLLSSVIEAVSEKKPGEKITPTKAEAVQAFLADAASGKQSEKKLLKDLKELQLESRKNVLFQTADKEGAVLRSSYIAK